MEQHSNEHGAQNPLKIHSPYLPDELLFQILSYIPEHAHHQRDIHAFTLVCRQWYNVAISRLYCQPYITTKNFDLFVRTLCPSVLVHVKKTDLSALVRVLDLRRLVHQSTKSLTARLLGRTKFNLEVFVAPAASFGVNSLAALSKCSHLKNLDLTLVYEAIPYATVFQALKTLPKLETLCFPRSSAVRDENLQLEHLHWPPQLRELHLAGGLSSRFMDAMTVTSELQPQRFPETLTGLSLTNSPILDPLAAVNFLLAIGPRLKDLNIGLLHRMSPGTFDNLLLSCPCLERLSIAIDYVTAEFLNFTRFIDPLTSQPISAVALALRDLRLTGIEMPSPNDMEGRLSPLDIEVAIEKGWLRNLRRVFVCRASGWLDEEYGLREELSDLAVALEDLWREDWMERKGVYEGRSGEDDDRTEYEPPHVLLRDPDDAAVDARLDWWQLHHVVKKGFGHHGVSDRMVWKG